MNKIRVLREGSFGSGYGIHYYYNVDWEGYRDYEGISLFGVSTSENVKLLFKCYPYEEITDIKGFFRDKVNSWRNLVKKNYFLGYCREFIYIGLYLLGKGTKIYCAKQMIPLVMENKGLVFCIAPYVRSRFFDKNFEKATGCSCPLILSGTMPKRKNRKGKFSMEAGL